MKEFNRPSWDSYFMSMAWIVASRSTCIAKKIGAVIVIDNRVIATGYNGLPSKFDHCLETGKCIRDIESCADASQSLAIHAEVNAIGQASAYGIATKGSTIYSTHQPCLNCLKAIVAAQIDRVVYQEPHKPNDLMGELIKRGYKIESFN